MQIVTSIILFASLGLLPLASTHAEKPNPSKMITILALGDSLTDGFGLSRKEAYPALLGEKMRAANYRFEIINAGLSGDTTAGGLRRLPTHLDKKRIDILIVALGINDVFRGVPVEQMRANLQAIIDQTRAHHPAVSIVVVGLGSPIALGNAYIQEFEGMYSALAEQNHAALVPDLLEGVAGNSALNQRDLLHPNAEGQRILAENVWRILEPIVKMKSGSNHE